MPDSAQVVRAEAKTIPLQVRASAQTRLPSGLGAWVAAGLVARVRDRSSAREARARAELRRPKPGGLADLPLLERGRTYHPTYGRGRYVPQTVKAGFVEDVLRQIPSRQRRALLRAVNGMASVIAGRK